jgi:hypothetical protein
LGRGNIRKAGWAAKPERLWAIGYGQVEAELEVSPETPEPE